MYATGIGLVIKGFQKLDVVNSRYSTTQQQVTTKKKKSNEVKNHSEKTGGRFFEKIFSSTLGFFEETDEQ
jgi:hypothetical protein